MSSRGKFLRKASAYTIMELMILVILVVISWGLGESTREAIAGTFFFAGLYLLIGSLIISGISRSHSAGPPSFTMFRVQNPYIVTRAYLHTPRTSVEKRIIRKESEPSPVLYGYFMGIILFFLGLILIAYLP